MSGVSVICPVRDVIAAGRRSQIEALLKSYKETKGKRTELIVVEGHSNDDTPCLVQSLISEIGDQSITLVKCPDAGIYAAINHGAALAKYDLLMFMGSDDYFTNGGVNQICTMTNARKGDFFYWTQIVRKGDQKIVEHPKSSSRVLFGNYFCFQSFAIRKSTFTKLGGFSTKYSLCADYDLALRLTLSSHTGRRLNLSATVIARTGASSSAQKVRSEMAIVQIDRLSEIVTLSYEEALFIRTHATPPVNVLLRAFLRSKGTKMRSAILYGLVRSVELVVKRLLKREGIRD